MRRLPWLVLLCLVACFSSPVSLSAWTTTTVDDSGGAGLSVSLALDASDALHISYNDESTREVKYATNGSGEWVISPIAQNDSPNHYSGGSTAIAVGGAGEAHVVYSRRTALYPYYRLEYTTNISGDWVATVVDSFGLVGPPWYVLSDVSMALDRSGVVHVVYIVSHYTGFPQLEFVNANLRYATNASGEWVHSVVCYDVGPNANVALALDPYDQVHVSYRNGATRNLMYLNDLSSSCSSTTVDSGTNVGAYASIAADAWGHVHISYYDVMNLDLKYATNASGSWVASTLDSEGWVGSFTSLALYGWGPVSIAYHDATNDALKVATNLGGAWSLQTACERPLGSGTQPAIAHGSSLTQYTTYVAHRGGEGSLLVTESPGPACTDMDGDRFNREGGICGPVDCADDPLLDPPGCATCLCGTVDCAPCARCIHPAARVMCDGVDNNCSGVIDDEPAASASCDDGLFCNGVESCESGACQAGVPPDCDDGIACTIDSCSEYYASCVHQPDSRLCDDGLWCNGPERCDRQLGCIPSPNPPNCDDGNPCTIDTCVEATQSCRRDCAATNPEDPCCDDPTCAQSPVCRPCFISTAAFGTPYHGKIAVLRAFRDVFLVKSDAGQAFVDAYLRHSPRVAQVIAEQPFLRTCVRLLLLPIVGVLFVVM